MNVQYLVIAWQVYLICIWLIVQDKHLTEFAKVVRDGHESSQALHAALAEVGDCVPGQDLG